MYEMEDNRQLFLVENLVEENIYDQYGAPHSSVEWAGVESMASSNSHLLPQPLQQQVCQQESLKKGKGKKEPTLPTY